MFVDLKDSEFELGVQIEEDPSTSQPKKALALTIAALSVEVTSIKKSAEQLSNEVMFLFVKFFVNLCM